jgi:diguanylate cyclase (GGDEF)-like protein/PAS domain S-box-containing protein
MPYEEKPVKASDGFFREGRGRIIMTGSKIRSATLDTTTFDQDVIPRLVSSGMDIQSEQTDLLYTQAPVALMAAMAVALLITVSLWGVTDHQLLLVWFGAQMLQTLVRSVLVVNYRRASVRGKQDPRWVGLYISGTLVSGIVWGCLGLLIDFNWPVEYQTLAIIGIAGVLAGAISSYAVMMPVYVAFLAPIIMITSQAMLTRASQSPNTMGLLFIVFAAALLVIARNYNQSVVRSLSLRHDNVELLQRMKKVNASLEGMIRERQQAEAELRRERGLFTEGPVSVYRVRAESGWPIEYISPAISQYGYDADRLMQEQAPFAQLIHPGDLHHVEQAEPVRGKHGSMSMGLDYRVTRPDGEARWIYDYNIPVKSDDGKVTHYAGYFLDITDRKREEYEHQREKERAQVTLHSIGDAVITTDVNGQVEYLNPVAEKFTGWESSLAHSLPVARIFNLFDKHSRRCIEGPIHAAIMSGNAIHSDHDCIMQRPDGSKLSLQYSASPIMSEAGEPLGVVLVFRDMTEARDIARQLTHQTTHDALTDLMNRREFEARLRHVLENLKKEDGRHVLCYLDIDQFKIINDTCGHAEGDKLIKKIAELLPECLRESDVLARLGGDEFGILLRNCSLDDALVIVEEIMSVLNVFYYVSRGNTFDVGASIGVAPINSDSESVVDVMCAADLACYAAKDMGRGRVHVYESSDRELARRHGEMQWVSRLTEAINNDRLVLYYQDIVPVVPEAGAGHHFEFLVRMLDENNEPVLPGMFMPAAEKYNLAPALDRWVISHSFAWYKDAGRYRPAAECQKMSINLSGASLAEASILDFIKTELNSNQIPPGVVCFEITETAAVTNLDIAIEFIKELRQLGCSFALDDFGTGLSSFAYLKNLPVDYLKIDGSFVRDIETNPVNRAMVKSIHQVGHVMGLETIAEFVENDAIRKVLADIGVDYAQGYGIAIPREISEMSTDDQQTA